MVNKRKNRRLDCLVPVDGKEGGVFSSVHTVDFSKGGLGLIAHSQIPLNEEVAIEIDFGMDEAPVLVLGKVRWVSGMSDSPNYRVGLSFETILKGGKHRLNKHFSCVD